MYIKKKQYLWGIFRIGSLRPHEKHTEKTRLILDIMSTFVRTTHTTHPLLEMSKMVVVLLLIFFPAIAFANPVFQSSSNRNSNPSAVGSQSMQYQLESYQMTNTSSYQVGTTYNPAQTIYEPFSNEAPGTDAPGSNNPSKISNRRNAFESPDDPNRDPESPIGDAWPLLFFAALAAGVIYIKQRKAEARG